MRRMRRIAFLFTMGGKVWLYRAGSIPACVGDWLKYDYGHDSGGGTSVIKETSDFVVSMNKSTGWGYTQLLVLASPRLRERLFHPLVDASSDTEIVTANCAKKMVSMFFSPNIIGKNTMQWHKVPADSAMATCRVPMIDAKRGWPGYFSRSW